MAVLLYVLACDTMHDVEVMCQTTKKPSKRLWPARPADLLQAHAATTSHIVILTQNRVMNMISVLTLNSTS